MPKFNIGDMVYEARAWKYAEAEVTCPVCFGKRSVTVILGNGEHQPVQCEYCATGYDGPRGIVSEYGPRSSVVECRVTGIEQHNGSYRYQLDGHSYHDEENMFATQEEAEVWVGELVEEMSAECDKDNAWKQLQGKKKLTYQVGYARKRIKAIESELAWHKAKLSDLQAQRAKEATTNG